MTESELSATIENNFLIDDFDRTSPGTAETIENIEESVDSSNMNNLVTDIADSEQIPPLISDKITSENAEESVESSVDSGISSTTPSEESKEDEWLDIMGSGNFKKKILKPGTDHESRPGRGDRVTVDVKFFLKDHLIEEHVNLIFIVGDMDVIQGLDLVICLMEKDEKARVMIPAKLAYGKKGRSPDIPPESDLECEIELKEVESLFERSLTIADRLQLGNDKRARGNFFYEREEYIDAIHCYERAASYLEGIRDSSGSSAEESQKIVDTQIKVYNNMAASHLKLSAYQAALKSVESVLKVQPKNVKALFRKAKILGSQGSTDEAIACLKVAEKLEPDTKIIHAELIKMRNQKIKEEQSQKAMYKRMFPQSEPKKTSSFSKIVKWSALSAGVMAVVAGMAAYRQFNS